MMIILVVLIAILPVVLLCCPDEYRFAVMVAISAVYSFALIMIMIKGNYFNADKEDKEDNKEK